MSTIDSGVSSAVFSKLAAVTADIGAIGKTNRNEFQKYSFRSVAQAMAALQPLLIRHGLVLQPTYDVVKVLEQDKGSGAIVKLTLTFWSVDDGSCLSVSCVGQGSDSGDKAIPKAIACAFKYCVFSTFCVPEEGVDSEFSEPEVKPKKAASKAGGMREILG